MKSQFTDSTESCSRSRHRQDVLSPARRRATQDNSLRKNPLVCERSSTLQMYKYEQTVKQKTAMINGRPGRDSRDWCYEHVGKQAAVKQRGGQRQCYAGCLFVSLTSVSFSVFGLKDVLEDICRFFLLDSYDGEQCTDGVLGNITVLK